MKTFAFLVPVHAALALMSFGCGGQIDGEDPSTAAELTEGLALCGPAPECLGWEPWCRAVRFIREVNVDQAAGWTYREVSVRAGTVSWYRAETRTAVGRDAIRSRMAERAALSLLDMSAPCPTPDFDYHQGDNVGTYVGRDQYAAVDQFVSALYAFLPAPADDGRSFWVAEYFNRGCRGVAPLDAQSQLVQAFFDYGKYQLCVRP